MNSDPDLLAETLAGIAVEAGRLLAAVADRSVGRQTKPDGTSACAADLAAEALILAGLRARFPDIPIVAEESMAGKSMAALPAAAGRFFLVDPLDGTGDYLSGEGEYSVNIALVEGDRPVAAGLAVPVLDRVWAAGRTARVAAIPSSGAPRGWERVGTRPLPEDGATALVSRRHGDGETERCLAKLPIADRRTVSSAAKFALVASGEADVYVRCGPTMEWDTAAGDALVAAAGGRVVGLDGAPLVYGRAERGYRNGPFAACGDPKLLAGLALPETAVSPARDRR